MTSPARTRSSPAEVSTTGAPDGSSRRAMPTTAPEGVSARTLPEP